MNTCMSFGMQLTFKGREWSKFLAPILSGTRHDEFIDFMYKYREKNVQFSMWTFPFLTFYFGLVWTFTRYLYIKSKNLSRLVLDIIGGRNFGMCWHRWLPLHFPLSLFSLYIALLLIFPVKDDAMVFLASISSLWDSSFSQNQRVVSHLCKKIIIFLDFIFLNRI